MRFQASLIGRVMAVAVLASVAITGCVSIAVYRITYAEITEYREDRLIASTVNRAKLQMAVFEQIEAAQQEARNAFYRVRGSLDIVATRERFDELFPPFGDGTRRSSDSVFEGFANGDGRLVYGAAGYIPRGDEISDTDVLNYMSGVEIVNDFGPGMHGAVPNFWFFTTRGDIFVFAPKRPDELRPYRFELPANFDFSDQEIAKLATHAADPLREMRCGALSPMVYDRSGSRSILTSSCQTPIDDPQGRYIGSFGVTLPLTGWMNDTVRREASDQKRFMIVSPRYGLLAHSAIDSGHAGDRIAELADEEMLEELRPLLVDQEGVLPFEGTDSIVAYATIEGPDWLLVSVQPKSVVTGTAATAAGRAAMLTSCTAVLLLLVIGVVFYRLIARPLHGLVRDADRSIGEGTDLTQLSERTDEIGALSKALLAREERVHSLVETLEQRVAERTGELERSRQDAEAANEAKTAFLATMSHEIRTPMNGVVGMAEALARTELNEEQQEFLEVMRRSGESLLSLIDDILDISKIEAGKLKLEPLAVRPSEIIEEVCGLYREAADRKGIAVRTDISAITNTTIMTDPLRLRQILANLVSNAIKFTETGTVDVHALLQGADKIRIDVTDTGPGIPGHLQHVIFDKFEQAENSTTRRFGGTGLGLAISRELAQLLGGDLAITSKEGEGATFSLTIKAQPATGKTATEAKKPLARDNAAQGSIKGLRVLAAEDLAVNRQVLAAICKPLGISLSMAENGLEAIEMLRDGDYDAVLMDLRMPVMDGLEAMRRIRDGEAGASARNTPIIALTANAMREHVEESLAAGADAHVAKPVSRRALIDALVTHCELEEPGEAVSSPHLAIVAY